MDVPMEGSKAGDVFAVMVVLAPVLSVIISSFVKPKSAAFFLSLLSCGLVIGGSFWYAGTDAQVAGLSVGALAFGGWAAILSFFLTCAVIFGRTFITHPQLDQPTSTGAGD